MNQNEEIWVNAIDNYSEPLGRLRAALDASCVVGIWDWDIADQSIVYDVGAARLLAGDASLAEQKISGYHSIAAVHPADHGWMIQEVQRAIRSNGLMLAEFRVMTEGGGIRWLLSRGRTTQDENGNPLRARGIIIDITEMRGSGERYVWARPDSVSSLEHVADLAIAVKLAISPDIPNEVRLAADLLLISLGRALGRDRAGH